MNTCQRLIKSSCALGALLSLATVANPMMAAPVDVQTLATASNAVAGKSGASIEASALIEVLVTDSTGNPVDNLGSTVSNGTSAIALPNGWQLDIPTVPPGGCLVTPTQFANQRDGLYSIRIVPFVNNASCRWLSGDYIYRIRVDTASADGSALGILSIR